MSLESLKFVLCVRQSDKKKTQPVKLKKMEIHASQAQTLNNLGIYCKKSYYNPVDFTGSGC